jgi:hypothetical protein
VATIREVRVTTTDGKTAIVKVEYEDGTTRIIVADQLSIPSPLEPAAAKIQVANQLGNLSVNPPHVEPNQIIIEWEREKGNGTT